MPIYPGDEDWVEDKTTKDYITHQNSNEVTCPRDDLFGRILWLPNRAIAKMLPWEKMAPHPILIASEIDKEGMVEVLLCTSFREKTLSERIPTSPDLDPDTQALARKVRSYFLPIEGCVEPEHPDNPVKNSLVTTTRIPSSQKRSSYVNGLFVRKVPFNLLEAFHDGGNAGHGTVRYSSNYRIDVPSRIQLGKFLSWQKKNPPKEEVADWSKTFKVQKEKKGNKR